MSPSFALRASEGAPALALAHPTAADVANSALKQAAPVAADSATQDALANAVREGGRRKPPAPCLIEPLPTGLVPFPTVAALVDRLTALLEGRPFRMVLGHGAMAGFDAFAKITVYAEPRGAADPAASTWIAAVVLDGPDGPEADRAALTAALQAARRPRGC